MAYLVVEKKTSSEWDEDKNAALTTLTQWDMHVFSWFHSPFGPFIMMIFVIQCGLLSVILSTWSTYQRNLLQLEIWGPQCCSYFLSFQKCDSCSWVWVWVWVCFWAVTASSSLWEKLPWPERVPVKTHLWIHMTYLLWSMSRPTANSLPLPFPSVSVS